MWTFHPTTKLEPVHIKFKGEKMFELHAAATYQQGIAIVSALNKEIVQEHCISDEECWWNMYHEKYPNFTIGEIAKMVRSGILED